MGILLFVSRLLVESTDVSSLPDDVSVGPVSPVTQGQRSDAG
ncbi:MAG: hypothetical protein ABWY50_07440 [Aeromicrobium sp.]